MSLESPPHQLIGRYWGFYNWLLPRFNILMEEFPNAQATSWYRSAADNVRVGGSPYSQHRLAWAADFAVPQGEHRDFVNLARELRLVAVDEVDHIHVQMYPAGVIPKTFFT